MGDKRKPTSPVEKEDLKKNRVDDESVSISTLGSLAEKHVVPNTCVSDKPDVISTQVPERIDVNNLQTKNKILVECIRPIQENILIANVCDPIEKKLCNTSRRTEDNKTDEYGETRNKEDEAEQSKEESLVEEKSSKVVNLEENILEIAPEHDETLKRPRSPSPPYNHPQNDAKAGTIPPQEGSSKKFKHNEETSIDELRTVVGNEASTVCPEKTEAQNVLPITKPTIILTENNEKTATDSSVTAKRPGELGLAPEDDVSQHKTTSRNLSDSADHSGSPDNSDKKLDVIEFCCLNSGDQALELNDSDQISEKSSVKESPVNILDLNDSSNCPRDNAASWEESRCLMVDDVFVRASPNEAALQPFQPRRKRQKHIINALQKIMEFYFSRANLSQDRFLRSKMSDDFYVDLPLFLTFNKVKSLTQELKLLQYAVRNSPFLGLSPDGLRVKRTLYYPKKENELDCIVYVDHLARNTTVDWIWEYFEQFGVVEFVSLPRYKDSHRCRGFAFIEFDTPESAVNAVEAHSPTGNPDISACTNYSNLDSLERSFNEEVHNVPDSSCHVDNENSPLGDRLHLPQDSNSVSNVTTTTADASAVVASEAECTDESQKASPKNLDHGIPRNEDLDVATPAERHQLQRRNSKTSRPLEKRKRSLLKRKTTDADHTDHLLVLPKRVWLQRREAYLAEQKKRLSMCKKIMKADRLQQEALKIDFDVPKPRKQMPVKNPGCVVRVTLDQPIEEKSSIISGVKAFCGSGVEFVDCSVGEKVFHVRFSSREGAHSFRYGSSWKNKSTIIEGAEEDVFWQRVQSCWIARITGPRIRKKIRGKQKVISRWRARQEALEGIGGEDGLPDHNNDQE